MGFRDQAGERARRHGPGGLIVQPVERRQAPFASRLFGDAQADIIAEARWQPRRLGAAGEHGIDVAAVHCGSACKKDPVSGVIGV